MSVVQVLYYIFYNNHTGIILVHIISSVSSTVVEYSPLHPKVQGLSSAAASVEGGLKYQSFVSEEVTLPLCYCFING